MTSRETAAAARLRSGLEQLGLAGSDRAQVLLDYADAVLEANKRTNLVGTRDLDGLALLILDALAPLARRSLRGPVVDIGSGAGLPGVAAAIVFQHLHFVLLEPRAKRAAFLEATRAQIGLSNVTVRKLTAQRAAAGPLGASFGTALARAVATPATALALGLPLVRPGGTALMYLGRQARPTASELQIIKRLGGTLEEATAVSVPYLAAARHIWAVRKGAMAGRRVQL